MNTSAREMSPRVRKALTVAGVAWCGLVVGVYLAMLLFSAHGRGFAAGWPLVILACWPGVWLMGAYRGPTAKQAAAQALYDARIAKGKLAKDKEARP